MTAPDSAQPRPASQAPQARGPHAASTPGRADGPARPPASRQAAAAQDAARARPAPRKQLSAAAVSRFKPILFLLGLFPLARWIWLGMNNGLTANPVEFLTRSAGTWTFVCLLVTLGITPLRRLAGQPALVRLRRMCGLFAFFYGFLHFMSWVAWDRGFDPASMLQDVGQRPFITVGFAAFVLMSALAATSTQGAMRRMGKRWQQLHRAVYAIGILAALHLLWDKSGKHDFQQPIAYGSVLAVLLLWRVYAWAAARRKAGAKAGAKSDSALAG
ncbi:protein-methionine-sulfoxide reductase heme-binding subunit MsrQ [Bordetella genomosp. 11]|uniref:Protein-methionine-sulfoxide reductase heme-binding subunit MsrQ n=1 Tax=Bordetella genomosp. 11 TaxID=1416808 RepID=A0A261UPQ8_9BORD|nr:protein-methionine-sulfoxide reductase heme-binding subunit MsrQ [Bordetella genomosp. 11]OZI63250.1 sulfoxide reductase heme-binding subunit YedZ [Bordetella genomosp. 11]